MSRTWPEVRVEGERWFPDERPFASEIREYWGDWYCDSECGTLRAVLMHRPGAEVARVGPHDFAQFRWKAPMEVARAAAEHDALCAVYRDHGVAVHYVEGQRVDRPNALFVRDQVLMTPEGAIVCRLGIGARRGEERAVAQTLAKLGVPIIRTVNGDGVFDGACALWVDRTTVIIGTGARANNAGAGQVEHELRNLGVEHVIRFQIPYGHAHLDGLLNFPDRRTALLFPWQVPYDVVKALLDLGFTVVEADDPYEVKALHAVNVVALRPGKVVAPAGAVRTHTKLREAGVEVVPVVLEEIQKGWGATHCMTAFLNRDPIDS